MIDTQRHGGWVFTHAFPSGMRFLSTKVVLPNPERYFNGAKDGNSAYGAFWMAAAYDVLGEKAYLEAAERTAETQLKLQQPELFTPFAPVFNNMQCSSG